MTMTNRSNSRIDLNWGGGEFSVLLDIRTNKLYAYSDSETVKQLHEELGGKNYYESLTGLSGAGWVPARPYLRLLSTYRTDASIEDMSFGIPNAGVGPVVPIDYFAGTVPLDEYPAVVLEAGDELLLGADSLAVAVCGADIPATTAHREFTVIRSVGAEPEKVECEVAVATTCCNRPRSFSRLTTVVKALNFSRLSFAWPETADDSDISGYNPRNCARWFARLELYVFGGAAHKVAGGICYDRLSLFSEPEPEPEPERPRNRRRQPRRRSDDEKMARLQAIAPRNVAFLAVNVYLQGSDKYGYDAVGLFDCSEQSGGNGSCYYEYEIAVKTEDALRAMAFFGDTRESIIRQLREGAEAKAAGDAGKYQTAAALAAAIESHGAAVVTIADSLAAHNCEPGTRQFAEQHFAGRDSVTLSELAPFAGRDDVKRVIRAVIEREAQGTRADAGE